VTSPWRRRLRQGAIDVAQAVQGILAILSFVALIVLCVNLLPRLGGDQPKNVLRELAELEHRYCSERAEELVLGSCNGNYAHLDQLGGGEPSFTPKHEPSANPWRNGGHWTARDLRCVRPSHTLPPGTACRTSLAIAGWFYASYLASDARTFEARLELAKGEHDAGLDGYRRAVASQEHYVIVAWPEDRSGGQDVCWYVDQSHAPRRITLRDVRGPDDVVIAAYGSIDLAVGMAP
jgi:hypothetical protein